MTVHPSADGTATVRWELDTDAAEAVLTLLARAALADPSEENQSLLDNLNRALVEATDLTSPLTIEGCPGLWPDATPIALIEPAVIRNDLGTMFAVLLPGSVPLLEAVPAALAMAQEYGATFDASDVNLMADWHSPRWMVLNACERSEHSFHPELARHGAKTEGAVQVTRVDFTHA